MLEATRFFYFTGDFLIFFVFDCLHLDQGIHKAESLYKEAETKNTILVRRMLILFIYAETFLFVPPLLLPVFYAIFQMPDRDSWILPVDVK